jgi:hypothetical protein
MVVSSLPFPSLIYRLMSSILSLPTIQSCAFATFVTLDGFDRAIDKGFITVEGNGEPCVIERPRNRRTSSSDDDYDENLSSSLCGTPLANIVNIPKRQRKRKIEDI